MTEVAALLGVARFDVSERMNSAERVSPVSAADCERIAAFNRVDTALHAWALPRVLAGSAIASESLVSHSAVNGH